MDDIEARLDALQLESEQRKAELRALAVDLPQATSRRAVLAAMGRGIVDAPDKWTLVTRAVSEPFRVAADRIRSLRG